MTEQETIDAVTARLNDNAIEILERIVPSPEFCVSKAGTPMCFRPYLLNSKAGRNRAYSYAVDYAMMLSSKTGLPVIDRTI